MTKSVAATFEIFQYPTYPESEGDPLYTPTEGREEAKTYIFAPSSRIPDLIESLRNGDASPLGDILEVLLKYVPDTPYGCADFEEAGFGIEPPEGNLPPLTFDEAVAIKLIEYMASSVYPYAVMGLGLDRLGFVDVESHDGQAILADLEDAEDADLDSDVWSD